MALIEDPGLRGLFTEEDTRPGHFDSEAQPYQRVVFADGTVERYLDPEGYGIKIVIYRELGPSIFSKRKHRVDLPLLQLTSIEFTKAGLFVPGALRFLNPGHDPDDPRIAVVVDKTQNRMAEYVRQVILEDLEMKRRQQYFLATVGDQAGARAASESLTTELIQLKTLLDQGALTRDEFEQAKQGVLRRMKQ